MNSNVSELETVFETSIGLMRKVKGSLVLKNSITLTSGSCFSTNFNSSVYYHNTVSKVVCSNYVSTVNTKTIQIIS